MIDQLDARQIFSAARLFARQKMPYFAKAIYNLIPIFTTEIDTLAVTHRGVCLVNPNYVLEVGVQVIAMALIHEIGHLLRDHHGRGASLAISQRNQKTWNICCDAEINDDLRIAFRGHGLETPADWVYPAKLPHRDGSTSQADGLLAEQYWANLPSKGGGDGDGESSDGADGDDSDAGGGGEGDGPPTPGAGGCGSCAGNKSPGEPDASQDGQVNGQGRSDAELNRIRRQVAKAIQQHAESKGAGAIPGSWKVWADAHLKPARVRWEDRVTRAARRSVAAKAGQVDFRYDRPSRRQSTYGSGIGAPVLPRMFAPVPNVVVVVDTSGSMGRERGELVMSEVDALLKALGVAVTFMAMDAEVQAVRKVTNINDAFDCLEGGGGTRFVPAIEALEEMRPRPDLVIFGTDGDNYDTLPVAAPAGMDFIWLLVSSGARVPTFAGEPWGEFIKVTNEDLAELQPTRAA